MNNAATTNKEPNMTDKDIRSEDYEVKTIATDDVTVARVIYEAPGKKAKRDFWIASLTDTDEQFGFKREFKSFIEFARGDEEMRVYDLVSGVYDIKMGYQRSYVRVVAGEMTIITKEQAMSRLEKQMI
jgi:hypothetical protein